MDALAVQDHFLNKAKHQSNATGPFFNADIRSIIMTQNRLMLICQLILEILCRCQTYFDFIFLTNLRNLCKQKKKKNGGENCYKADSI